MRCLTIGAVCLLVAAGCGRSKPPLPASQGWSPVQPAAVEPADGGETPAPVVAPVGPAFRGKNAKQWDQQMEARDAALYTEAAVALGRLGETGFPYLMARMQRGSDDVRMQSLLAMGKPELVGHARQTMPLLSEMLSARSPSLRQAAASRFAWYGDDSRQAIPALERLAKSDDNADVRRVAASAIAEINEYFDAKQRLADFNRKKGL
jgi:hypothetical protein